MRTVGFSLLIMGGVMIGLVIYAATWDDPNAWKDYLAAAAPFVVPGLIISIVSR